MHDTCTYHLDVQGKMDEAIFNASSPLRIRVVRTNQAITRFRITADQSALVGLIRHLHSQGFVLQSVKCYPQEEQ